MIWIIRFFWFIIVSIATYIVHPIVYVLGWILFPIVFNFKVRSLQQIKQDIFISDWQEVDSDPLDWDKHTHYKNPLDFLLKRNPTYKY